MNNYVIYSSSKLNPTKCGFLMNKETLEFTNDIRDAVIFESYDSANKYRLECDYSRLSSDQILSILKWK